MADKRGKNFRTTTKFSKVETRKLIEILSRKLANQPGQSPLKTTRLLEVVTSQNDKLTSVTLCCALKSVQKLKLNLNVKIPRHLRKSDACNVRNIKLKCNLDAVVSRSFL